MKEIEMMKEKDTALEKLHCQTVILMKVNMTEENAMGRLGDMKYA